MPTPRAILENLESKYEAKEFGGLPKWQFTQGKILWDLYEKFGHMSKNVPLS